jgi:hypothetical protein
MAAPWRASRATICVIRPPKRANPGSSFRLEVGVIAEGGLTEVVLDFFEVGAGGDEEGGGRCRVRHNLGPVGGSHGVKTLALT